jgi:CheY-like chemotaxis protein
MDRKKILIIDDEVSFTNLLKLNLEQLGEYQVRIENNGALGFSAAKEFVPDMIFLDIVMPEMDGADVAVQLAGDADTKKIPLVFLTAIVEKGEVDESGHMIGGHSFLAKPVKLHEIVECIEINTGK